MSIYGDIQAYDPEAVVTVFELWDKSKTDVLRFHAGVNEFMGDVVWQSNTYIAIPIKVSGFDFSGTQFPRPKMQVANYQGVFSGLVIEFDDLINYTVVKKCTLAKYLDAVNFVDGNPTANPLEHFPDEVYKIVQKTQENRLYIEFELGSPLDVAGVMLPRRQAIAGVCTHTYRSELCGYTGGPCANANDYPVFILKEDKCSQKVSGCKLRFGANGDLPYGGFVGMQLINS